MRILYPVSPFDAKQPDETFREEYFAVQRDLAGKVEVGLFAETPADIAFRVPAPATEAGVVTLYRGWMLSPEIYDKFRRAIEKTGGSLRVSKKEYLKAHWLPEWYPDIGDLTAPTIVFPEGVNVGAHMRTSNWKSFFVKDFVKSSNTGGGSLVHSFDQIDRVVADIRHYRGGLEGGVCIRQGEKYLPGTERRYFVINGVPWGAENHIPDVVHQCATRMAMPFYSVDVAERDDGVLRIIELGDGQVSDIKEWPLTRFTEILGVLARSAS